MTSESSRAALIDFLLTSYGDLKRRLARRLGSDAAEDALQDTFLRLSSNVEIGPVRSPQAYLLGVAVRLAADRRRRDILSDPTEVELLFDIIDDAPDPERIVGARSEVEVLKLGMRDMPQRRRAIFMAAAVDEIPSSVLAARFGVTKRTIQLELKLALIHCAKLLDRNLAMRMPPRRGRLAPDSDGGSEDNDAESI